MFITFEGIEGSGKGTMLEMTGKWLEQQGKTPLHTREPGGSALGRELRAILLNAKNSNLAPEAELFLYLADRAQHVRELVEPALREGKTVLSDRYADSTIVYQGYGRGLDTELLFSLNDTAVNGLWPDLTLVLDMDVEEALDRAKRRNHELGVAESEGRFEAEAISFHQRIRRGYQEWAARNSARIKIIPATGSREDVFARVRECMVNHLNL